ncbi:MAG: hypothetical protein LBB44_01420 [Endomicrobium sp.]|jgi:tetratricopeptide (TPR) repeat protein|nr:hypothetical protein [Endomicrobium sp.]
MFNIKLNLLIVFCLISIVTLHVAASESGYAIRANEQSRIAHEAFYEFSSKCQDKDIEIKEVCEAYKTYKKAVKTSNRTNILVEEKRFEGFKEDYYPEMSKVQRKDIESAYRAYIRAIKADQKAVEAEHCAIYNVAKADRNCKISKTGSDKKIAKARECLKKMKKRREVAYTQRKAAYDIYVPKMQIIREGDNIFTRVKKRTKIYKQNRGKMEG